MAVFDLPFSIFVFLSQIRSSVSLSLHLRPSDLALEPSRPELSEERRDSARLIHA